MGYNALSGTVVMPGIFQVPEGSFLSGNLSTSDAANVKNVPRVSNATNNALITNVSGDANTLTCESNLLFDGSTLSLTGDLTASINISASSFYGDGSNLTNVKADHVVAEGPEYAIQFHDSSDGDLTGSSGLTFSGSTLSLVGSLTSSGAASFQSLNIHGGVASISNAGAATLGAITATSVTSSGAGGFQSLAINGGHASIDSAGALVVREITASAGMNMAGDLYVDKIRRYSDSGTTTKILLNDEVIKLYAGHHSDEVLSVQTDQATLTGHLTASGDIIAAAVSGTYGYFKNDVTSSAAGKFATLDINNGVGTISAAGALDIGAITATTVSGTYGYFKNDVTSSAAGKFATLDINNGSAGIDAGGSLRLSSSAYLNWGNTTGASGYGLRDNNGTIQFKTHTGSWADLGSGTGGGGSGNANGQGATGSIQYHTSGGTITGSARLRFINDNLVMTGSLFMTGALEVDGTLLPATGNTHNLGSAAKPWGTLYVSSSSIYFGTEKVSVENNNLRFGSGSTTKGFQVGFMRFRDKGITMAPDQLFELKAFQMSFAGGIAYKRRVVAWDYQILKTDYIVSVQTDTVTASVTLTLPNADDCTNGQTFVIKDEGGAANTRPIQIDCSGSDVIDGQNTILLESPYAAIQVYCNGSDKYFIV